MTRRKEEVSDFYDVLGLKKDCSDLELRNAYKKLALKWHPDKCLNLDNPKDVDDSKQQFLAIQEAYSGSFEALQGLFEEMFPDDFIGLDSCSKVTNTDLNNKSKSSPKGVNKRTSVDLNVRKSATRDLSELRSFEANALNDQVFCFGVAGTTTESRSGVTKHKTARKPKPSARRDC